MTNLTQGEVTQGEVAVKKVQKKEKTEIRLLRESYGITVTELCKELNLQRGLYSTHEGGGRKYKGDRYEEFYYKVANALETIRKRRYEASHCINGSAKFSVDNFDDAEDINIQLGLNCKDILEEEEEEEVLVYQPINEELYNKSLQLMAMGKSTVWIASRLEIDELVLNKRVANEYGKEKSKLMIKGILAN